MDKLFSIITPTYNCEDRIEATIASVIRQNADLYEYIIVDGKSSDGTVDVIRKYEDKAIWISEKDNGIYDAINKAIEISQGQYIYVLGAGDYLYEGILEKIAAVIPRTGLNFVYGNVWSEKEDHLYDKKFSSFKIAVKNICHQAIFYHKSIFENIGMFSEKYSILADHAFNIVCFGNPKINKVYINECIAFYQNDGISSRISDIQYYKDRYRIIKKHLGLYPLFYCVGYEMLKKIYAYFKKIRRGA